MKEASYRVQSAVLCFQYLSILHHTYSRLHIQSIIPFNIVFITFIIIFYYFIFAIFLVFLVLRQPIGYLTHVEFSRHHVGHKASTVFTEEGDFVFYLLNSFINRANFFLYIFKNCISFNLSRNRTFQSKKHAFRDCFP